jgi:hypothetical protein
MATFTECCTGHNPAILAGHSEGELKTGADTRAAKGFDGYEKESYKTE